MSSFFYSFHLKNLYCCRFDVKYSCFNMIQNLMQRIFVYDFCFKGFFMMSDLGFKSCSPRAYVSESVFRYSGGFFLGQVLAPSSSVEVNEHFEMAATQGRSLVSIEKRKHLSLMGVLDIVNKLENTKSSTLTRLKNRGHKSIFWL